jgi:hypothetical protein
MAAIVSGGGFWFSLRLLLATVLAETTEWGGLNSCVVHRGNISLMQEERGTWAPAFLMGWRAKNNQYA